MKRVPTSAALGAIGLGALGASPAVATDGEQRTYANVTEAIFECVKVDSIEAQGTVYEPRYGPVGVSTTRSALWRVVVAYEHDVAAGQLTYTLVYKSWIVPRAEIWNGIEDALARCSQ